MAGRKGRFRGLSAGSIAMIVLCAATIGLGAFIYARIAGDAGPLQIDLRRPAGDITGGTPPDASAPVPTQAAADTPAPQETPAPAPSCTLRLTAMGQVSAGQSLRNAAREGTGTYAFEGVFLPVAPAMGGADLSIATLRTGLTDSVDAFSPYRTPATLAGALRTSGVTLASLATDRLLDSGTQGLSQTLSALSAQGLASTGGYADAGARQAVTLQDMDGLKVGVVAFTADISAAGRAAAGEAEIAAATRLLTSQSAISDIAALKSAGADIIVALAHLGTPADREPSAQTRSLCDVMVNAGADIILCTGPTSVHPFERRSVPHPEGGAARDVFIAYSLGNFLSDESRETPDITGVIVHLDLEWNGATRRMRITNGWYLPTWIMRSQEGGATYRVVPAGAQSAPQGMTQGVYGNMQKAYDSLTAKLGTSPLPPRREP